MGGPVQANLGGASPETFSGEAQLKKSPCIFNSLCIDHNNVVLNTESNVIKKQIVAAAQIVQVNIT